MRLTALRTGLESIAGTLTALSRRGGVVFLFCLLPVSLFAGSPPSPAAKGRRAPGPPPETAMVYDDGYRPPAKDLLLSLEGDRKVEAAARFMRGLLLEDTPESDQAISQYLRSLALDPANSDLSTKLARVYLARGDVPAAINLLKDTIKAAPKQAQSYLALAYVYYTNQHKSDLALKYALQGQEIDPANALAYEYLIAIYRSLGQPQKINALLDRAAKVDSKNAVYWLHVGKLFIETYLMDDPAKAGDDLKKTTAIFQKAFAVGDGDANIVNSVADFYVTTKQVKDAIPLYERVIALDPNLIPPRENLARCYIVTEQPAKAAEALEGLIKINPAEPHAYEVLAKIYEDAGDVNKAAADYEQALLINPSYSQGYRDVAVLLLTHQQADKAVPILSEARRRFPDLPAFGYLLAMALERAKQHPQALAVFEQTEVEAQNTQPSLLDAQFYFEYGAAAEQAALYDRATQLMKKSLALDENNESVARTNNFLGYMFVDHNMSVEEGGDLIKRALEFDPNNGAYLDSLGWYYYRTNRFDQAQAQLSRAVEVTKPEDATVYEHLGDTYLKLNDTAKALNCWQKAVDLDPANPNLPGLTKKIADTKAVPAPVPNPTPKG